MTTNETTTDRNAPKAYFQEMTVKQFCRIAWLSIVLISSAIYIATM